MAQSKAATKKKVAVVAKPAAKAASKPKASVAKKAVAKAPAKKGAAKPAAKPAVKAAKKAAPKHAAKKAAPKAAPAKAAPAKAAPAKAAPAKAAAAKPAAKPAPAVPKAAAKRPVAVSHRPQKTAAVSVQPKAAKPAVVAPPPAPVRAKAGGKSSGGGYATEDDIRQAADADYMNDAQLAFFNERLLQMRGEVLAREVDVKERLHQREVFADPADRASAEEEHWLDLRLRERESLLLKKIDDALRRIRDKEYGYCEKTGEPIGIARLLARPTATVCVDIKGQDERAESQYRDR